MDEITKKIEKYRNIIDTNSDIRTIIEICEKIIKNEPTPSDIEYVKGLLNKLDMAFPDINNEFTEKDITPLLEKLENNDNEAPLNYMGLNEGLKIDPNKPITIEE